MALLDKKQSDLLFLDLLMPRKDGFAVLEHMKEKQYSFPVVVLSNLTEPSDEERCFALGAKEYIVKSQLDSGELWERVKKYLL